MLRIVPPLVVLCLIGARMVAQVPGADWPGWRGPDRNGTATSAGLFDGPFDLRVRWQRTLGAGYSGIAVAAGRAVTMFSDGKRDVLIALSAGTGEELWRLPLGPAYPGKDGSTGGPVSTPVIGAAAAFALSPRGSLVAADLASGRVGSSRVDLQACKLEYSIVSPK